MVVINKIIAWLATNPVISSAAIVISVTELQALLLKYKGNAFISWIIQNLISILNKPKK